MRKSIFVLLLYLLMLCLTVSCFASWPTYDHYRVDAVEYERIIKRNPPPTDFVTYDMVAFLGDLKEASFYEDYDSSYYYKLLSEQEETIGIYFNTIPFSLLGALDVESFPVYRYLDLVDNSNMLRLDMDAVAERLNGVCGEEDLFYLDIGEVTYWYNYLGDLIYIELINVDHWKCNITVNDCDFSKCVEGGWISRLLNFETAAVTAIEIKARIAGFYKDPWEQPLTICLSAVGGAVIAAVATWLATYFIMRKRRDVPAVTALEVGAEADGTPPDQPTPPDTPPTP